MTAGSVRGAGPSLLVAVVGIVACLAAAIGLQIARDRTYAGLARATERILYVRSGEAMKRIALGFDALAADVYWIRAIQHYGGDRLAKDRERRYELLAPLLDLTTTLDPYFSVAYRFGSIFLSEPAPGGPGRPDLAIKLLEKGIATEPNKWQYVHDLAFVHYWTLRDFKTAAQIFQKAGTLPNAPNWLTPLAAGMLTAGNDRASARFLWTQMLGSEEEWLRRNAQRSLQQIDALDVIDQLTRIVRQFPPPPGEAYSWESLVRRRHLRGVPLDPAGTPFDIDPATGAVTISKASSLFPLPKLPSIPKQ